MSPDSDIRAQAKRGPKGNALRPAQITKLFKVFGGIVGPCPRKETERLEWCARLVAVMHGHGLHAFDSADWQSLTLKLKASPLTIDGLSIPLANEFSYLLEEPIKSLISQFLIHALKHKEAF